MSDVATCPEGYKQIQTEEECLAVMPILGQDVSSLNTWPYQNKANAPRCFVYESGVAYWTPEGTEESPWGVTATAVCSTASFQFQTNYSCFIHVLSARPLSMFGTRRLWLESFRWRLYGSGVNDLRILLRIERL